jgi:hypothetical protein
VAGELLWGTAITVNKSLSPATKDLRQTFRNLQAEHVISQTFILHHHSIVAV